MDNNLFTSSMVEWNRLLYSILLPLAGVYETGNKVWVSIAPVNEEEAEPLRQLMARLQDDGSLRAAEGAGRNGPYQLTAQGYERYRGTINMLRAGPLLRPPAPQP